MRIAIFITSAIAASFAMMVAGDEARPQVESAAYDYQQCMLIWSSRHYNSETFPVEIVRKATEDCIDEMTGYMQAARQAPQHDGYRLYQIAFYEALQEVIYLRLTELR